MVPVLLVLPKESLLSFEEESSAETVLSPVTLWDPGTGTGGMEAVPGKDGKTALEPEEPGGEAPSDGLRFGVVSVEEVAVVVSGRELKAVVGGKGKQDVMGRRAVVPPRERRRFRKMASGSSGSQGTVRTFASGWRLLVPAIRFGKPVSRREIGLLGDIMVVE